MHVHPKCVLIMAATTYMVASAAPVWAARLYLGLPSGNNVAYRRDVGDTTWTRQPAADLPDVGSYSAPALADLDGDGDQDALVGENAGRVFAFQNTGNDVLPIWIRQPGWDPGYDVGHQAAPALADLDGDGDLDLLLGSSEGDITGFQNVGSMSAPAWRPRPAWDLFDFGGAVHPTLGDIDRDGRPDLLVGREQGDVLAFAGTAGAAPFTRRPEWDPPSGDRVAPALGDFDGDGRLDLFISDGLAKTTAFRFAAAAWHAVPEWTPPDPGSGPAVPALVPGPTGGSVATPAPPLPTVRPATAIPPTGMSQTATALPPTGARTATAAPPTGAPRTATPAAPVPTPIRTATLPGNGAPIARLSGAPTTGTPPLAVSFDASASTDPEGSALLFRWDFGDGTTADGATPANPGATLTTGAAAYDTAKATRDDGHFTAAVLLYLNDVALLLPLTTVSAAGPITIGTTNRIDRVAHWFLQRIGHDLGGIYFYQDLGIATCDRYELSLQYSRESAAQAIAGGFPQQPALNGTNENIAAAVQKLNAHGCGVPAPRPMFVPSGDATARISHTYVAAGRYVAQVTVSDGVSHTTAAVTIIVGTAPLPPPGSGDGNDDPLEGFGTTTPGGAGGRIIHISEATDAAVQAAFKVAKTGNAVVVFDVTGPIVLRASLEVTGSFVTIEGNGVTLLGDQLAWQPILEVSGHDVIARNLRLRNGSDNLRAQGTGAYNVVFSHISSTGALDDGVSIGYGAHDVTLQYSFLAGNTRSIFIKYGNTTNVTVHHTWMMKQWARGPLVSSNVVADLRNLIVEDWTEWGTRFEKGATGNVMHSLFTLGPQAHALGGKVDSALRLVQDGPVFTAGNMYEGLATKGPNGTATAAIAAPPITTLPVGEMEGLVRARAGALPRDALDASYIATTTGWRVNPSTALRLSVP